MRPGGAEAWHGRESLEFGSASEDEWIGSTVPESFLLHGF
jgi:hypothetical protein